MNAAKIEMAALEIVPLSAEQTYAFRQAVLWPDKPISHVMVPGDESALHLGAHSDGQLIGVASFYIDGPSARLRKMAILETYQRRGVGAALLRYAAGLLRNQGVETLWCDAREAACPFYAKLGFEIGAELFEKSGLMYRRAAIKIAALRT